MRAPSELEKEMRLRPDLPADLLIEDLAERLGLDGEVQPPVDLALLASLQSIVDVRETLSVHAGCLINEGGRLRIEVCATDSPQRQSFTIAHEICHTLLPGFELTRNFRCNPGGSMPRRREQLNIEWLADVGASELLLPRRFVRPVLNEREFGLETVEDVASVYGASLEATARRYVRLSPAQAFFAKLEFAPSRTNPTPELRVRSASWSPTLEVFIPPNKSIPRTHPIFGAAEGEYIDTIADMKDLKVPGRFLLSARPYPYYNNEGESVMRVLVLGLNHRSATQSPRR